MKSTGHRPGLSPDALQLGSAHSCGSGVILNPFTTALNVGQLGRVHSGSAY